MNGRNKYLCVALILLTAFFTASCGGSSGDEESSSESESGTKSGVYSQNGGTATENGKSYASTASNESAVYVYGGGTYTIEDGTLTKTGDSTDSTSGDFTGVNAIILAEEGATITLSNCNLSSSAKGANGVFAYGESGGATINVDSCTLTTRYNHPLQERIRLDHQL